MKKILLVLSLMMACMVNVNAQGTYRGFFDLGLSASEGGASIDITTTHGWQFNKNWFVGAGIGAINIIETYDYWGDTETGEFLAVPIFINARYDRLSEKALTFFAESDAGYCVFTDGGSPLYFSFMVGLRRRLTERIGLNFGIGFSIVPHYEYSWGRYSYYEDDSSVPKFNIKVGVDF